MSVHKVKSLFQNVRVRGFDSLKIGSVLNYLTDLKAENNDEIGHYGQTLIKNIDKINYNKTYQFFGVNSKFEITI